jgi:hypothetical protein
MTVLSPSKMRLWDRCRRAAMWSEDWQPIRVTPLGAAYAGLRLALETDQYTAPGIAREHVMQLAGERGVQTDRQDPYDIMVHHGHLAEVLARASRQPSQAEGLRYHPDVKLGSTGILWQPEAYLIDGGTRIMRFVLVSDWDDDRQTAECHDWATISAVSVTQLPMQLRVLVIGSSRNGRRYGHWTRARQHPYDKSLRFARRQRGEEFGEGWKSVWREHTKIGPDHWLEQMARDGVLREVAFTRNVIVPGQVQRDKVIEDIVRIGAEMEAAREAGTQFPMTRSACDLAGPGRTCCQYQATCYSPIEISPGESGLFRRREKGVGKCSSQE